MTVKYLVIFSVMMLMTNFVSAQLTSQDICTFCDCIATAGNLITSVDCKCNDKKSLSFASGQMNLLSQTKSFNISGCSRVHLDQSSFLSLKELRKMHITNCDKVTILPGVFESLFTLKIDNVNELILRPKVFMGARGVMSLIISDTNIPMIPTHAFYDWTGLDHLELRNVTIEEIETNAINISMRHMSQFVLSNSKINLVASYAIKIVSFNTLVTGTSFQALPRNAMALHAQQSVNISRNIFGNLEHSSIRLQSKQIDIVHNTFSSILGNEFQDTKVLKNEGDLPGFFSFASNIIHATNYPMILFNFHKLGYGQNAYTNIKGNMFTCDCGINTDDVIELVYINHDIFVDNYCRKPCMVSIFTLLHEYDNVCPSANNSLTSMNNVALCLHGNITMEVAKEVIETMLNKTREAKAMNTSSDAVNTSTDRTTVGIVPHYPEEESNMTKPGNDGSYLTSSRSNLMFSTFLYLFYLLI